MNKYMRLLIIILIILLLSLYLLFLESPKESPQPVIEAFLNIKNPDYLKPHRESVKKWLFSLCPTCPDSVSGYIADDLWSLSEFEKVRNMDRESQIVIVENILKNDFFSNM